MEQLKEKNSTKCNNLKLMGLLDAISAYKWLPKCRYIVHICYLPTTHQGLLINNSNYGATENTQISH